jgi:probable HAF family extracellular repeat protein
MAAERRHILRKSMFAAITIAVLLLGEGWCLAQGQTVNYSVTDLGTLGGAMSTSCGINDRGQITGRSALANGQVHAFLWQAGAMTDLGTLPGLLFSSGRTINNRGQVVGDSSLTGGPPFHAALWENGGVTALGALPGGSRSFAIGINNRGQVVGGARTAGNLQVHGFLWQDGEMKDLGVLLASDQQSVARAINSRDQIVGNSSHVIGDPPPPPDRAFLWQNDEMTDLGNLGGDWVIAFGINDLGQVVGASFTASGELHAFTWMEGFMTDLGTLGGTSSAAQPLLSASCNLQPHPGAFGGTAMGTFSLASGVNNRGQIVGRSIATNGQDHAFLWSDGAMVDLNDTIPNGSGWTLIEAASINGSGQIVGFGTINSQTHAFLLTPNEN